MTNKRVAVGTVHQEWDSDHGRLVPKRNNGKVLVSPKSFRGSVWVMEGDGPGEVEVVEHDDGPPSAITKTGRNDA